MSSKLHWNHFSSVSRPPFEEGRLEDCETEFDGFVMK